MSGATTHSGGANPSRLRVFRSFAWTMLGLLVGVVIVDVVVGRLEPAGSAAAARAKILRDPELGWVSRPGYADETYVINALGMRSEPVPEDADPKELRIVGVGASNPFGLYVRNEGTWSYRLEDALDGSTDVPVRVLNGAVEGYSIIQACRRAARAIEQVAPDLVIVVLVPDRQSLLDSSPALQWTRVGRELVPSDLVAGWPESLRAAPAAIHHGLLGSNLYRRYRTVTKFGAKIDPSVRFWVMTDEETPDAMIEPLEDTREELRELVDFAALSGVELRFAVSTPVLATSDETWERYLTNPNHGGAPPPGTGKHEPFDAMIRWLEPLELSVWDMRDVLFEIGSDRARYIVGKSNPHWSAAAHALVAEDWARRIEEEGLLELLEERRSAEPRERDRAAAGAGDPAEAE